MITHSMDLFELEPFDFVNKKDIKRGMRVEYTIDIEESELGNKYHVVEIEDVYLFCWKEGGKELLRKVTNESLTERYQEIEELVYDQLRKDAISSAMEKAHDINEERKHGRG